MGYNTISSNVSNQPSAIHNLKTPAEGEGRKGSDANQLRICATDRVHILTHVYTHTHIFIGTE